MRLRSRFVGAMYAPLAGAFIAACGGGDTNAPNSGIVHIANVVTNPLSGQCSGPHLGVQQTYSTTFNIQIVNTTNDDVTIQSVSSTGTIIRATSPGDIGVIAHTFNSLSFTPVSALVRAHDGDVTIIATMVAGCGPVAVFEEFYRDIQTTLRVQTSKGQFATQPVTIHVIWRPLA